MINTTPTTVVVVDANRNSVTYCPHTEHQLHVMNEGVQEICSMDGVDVSVISISTCRVHGVLPKGDADLIVSDSVGMFMWANRDDVALEEKRAFVPIDQIHYRMLPDTPGPLFVATRVARFL